MSSATLAGITVTRCELHLPSFGVWWAEVETAEMTELSGAVELVLYDLVAKGTIVAGAVWQARARWFVAGGAAGWGRVVSARSYVNDAGIARSAIVHDVAADCGETLDASALADAYLLGDHYVRAAAPGSCVLHELYPRGWYVGVDGATYVGTRAATQWSSPVTAIDARPELGVLVVATDTIAGLVPGCTIEGVTAVDVVHRLDGKELRTTVYGDARANASNDAEAFRKIFDALDPRRRFRSLCEYRIVSQSGERLNLQAVRASSGLPDLMLVRVRAGIAARADWTLGARVLVAFVDADPTLPVVVAGEDADSPGFAPSRLDLVGVDDTGVTPVNSIGRVVRYGDPITFSSPGPGTVTLPATGSLSRVRA